MESVSGWCNVREMLMSTREKNKRKFFSPQAREQLRVDNKRVETQGPWLISRCLFTL
jgi:hypothetical protein